MDYEYTLIYQKAEKGLSMFNNMIDRPQHPIANALKNELRDLLDDFRFNKRPRTIEARIRGIQQHLARARQKHDMIMRIEENIDLHQHMVRLCEDLRRLRNY